MKTAEQNFCLLQEIEANRRFLLMAYEQNPSLLANAEPRIRQLFQADIPEAQEAVCNTSMAKQRGISLIELIVFIVIIGVAVAGILVVMNRVVFSSADPIIRKQALAIAESMLEEIKLQNLSGVGCVGTLGANAARSGVSSVCDYDTYSTTGGILDFSTNLAVGGLAAYNITNVAVTQVSPLGGTVIAAGSGVVITVTVTSPTGETIDAIGYRVGR